MRGTAGLRTLPPPATGFLHYGFPLTMSPHALYSLAHERGPLPTTLPLIFYPNTYHIPLLVWTPAFGCVKVRG